MNIISITSHQLRIQGKGKVLAREAYQKFYRGDQIIQVAKERAAYIEKKAKKKRFRPKKSVAMKKAW